MTHKSLIPHRQLVLTVNELFHDLEGESYEEVHPEIFKKEQQRWKQLLNRYARPMTHPITVLDIGCGTGFVTTQMEDVLRDSDTCICADVSATMLHIAAAAVRKKYPKITVRTIKLNNEQLPIETATVDIVTMNSVLHHIPDPQIMIKEIGRVLKGDGMLFIGHEPNIRFVQSAFLANQIRIIHALRPKRLLAQCLRLLHIIPTRVSVKEDALTHGINTALLEKKFITEPLTRSEIAKLIDVHSPTAGGDMRTVGFDPWNVLATVRNIMNPIHIETYNHLGKLSGRHTGLKPYERLLSLIAPKAGATFFLVAKKEVVANSAFRQ